MRVVKTYIAFDETEFDDEEECVAYEAEKANQFAATRENVVLFDAKGFPLKYEDEDDFLSLYDSNVTYILVKTDLPDGALQFIKNRGYYAFPSTRGFYFYYDYDWKNIATLIAPIYVDLKENGFI